MSFSNPKMLNSHPHPASWVLRRDYASTTKCILFIYYKGKQHLLSFRRMPKIERNMYRHLSHVLSWLIEMKCLNVKLDISYKITADFTNIHSKYLVLLLYFLLLISELKACTLCSRSLRCCLMQRSDHQHGCTHPPFGE